MAKEVSLFEHNEKAYEALVSSLEDNSLAFIEHATGTGKSFILLKYLYTKMREKGIFFVTRHYEMLEQLFHEQMETLGLSKEDFVKFDSTIYPNILDLDMNEVIQNYDCIVWDEAHHCGAPQWSVKVNEIKELVKNTPGKVMIGATATRIRYLDDYMDVAEKFFDGNVVSVLSVTRAILKNLLPAPLIIMTAQSCLERIEKVQKKLHKVPQVPTVQYYQNMVSEMQKRLMDEFYVGNILKKYGVQQGEKYIVFCSDIKDLKRKMQDAQEWFKDIGPIEMFCAHSEQKRTVNVEQIASFSKKREATSLMFAVDIFNEGFHIDGVDGILVFRKTKSPIIYWQQLGRALSFSARKKQIKIYDFANNTSDNKIVYELYKEMLEEARRLIVEDPENKTLYMEILSHFQIVDQTTSILEKLQEIENKIDQEFIIKDRVNLAIYKLEEYRSFYPTTDFNEELKGNRLVYEYVRAYNYICEVEDYLTVEQVQKLQSLHIRFTSKIDLPSNKRLELLGDSKTFKELEEKKLNDFISSYINFCKENNRRPTIHDDRELYLSYRSYLINLSRSKLNRLLAQIPFRLTLEETILLGNYPSRDDINAYIEAIKLKVNQNHSLDAVEIKVLKKISHVISQKDTELLQYLEKYTDIHYQIEVAIATIKNYQEQNDILNTKDYKKALNTIKRFAFRITNRQFAQLLELGIKLPPKINMTMEKRLQELNGFDSFYEKKQHENNGIIKSYLLFLQEHKRRPNLANEQEAKLVSEYEKQMFRTIAKSMRKITSLLIQFQIPLTLEESILTGNVVDIKDVESFILKTRNKLMANEQVTSEELKMLRAIEKNQYPLRLDISSFIKMVVTINEIDKMLQNYTSGSMNDLQKKNLLHSIFHRGRFLTRQHVQKLQALQISVPTEITDSFSRFPNFINVFEKEIREQMDFWNQFLEYLKNNGSYPEKDTNFMQKYRQYLGYASKEMAQQLLNQIKALGIKLGIEERILLQETSKAESIAYFEKVKEKAQNNEKIDSLEIRICRLLDKTLSVQYSDRVIPSQLRQTNDLENSIVRNIQASIRLNPIAPIDLENNYSLSRQNKRKLEVYRVNILGNKVFGDILRIIKKEKKPIAEVIDENLQSIYNSIAGSQDLDSENEFLFHQIRELDREYTLRQRGIAISEFVVRYIEFIQKSNGVRPNVSSEDEEESNLAITYESVHDLLDSKDIQKIERALKTSIHSADVETFFPRFIDFINEFGRFPCGNSDNSTEVHLNTLFQNIGSSLSKEQNEEIKKLRKIYGRATILANLEFSKKRSKPKS